MREQRRNPITPQQLAHGGAGAGPADKIIELARGHAMSPSVRRGAVGPKGSDCGLGKRAVHHGIDSDLLLLDQAELAKESEILLEACDIHLPIRIDPAWNHAAKHPGILD